MSKINTYWRLAKYKEIPALILQGDEYLELIEYKNSDWSLWLVGKYYNIKGNYFWDKGNIPKAYKYYIKALKISKRIKNNIEIARAYNNLGNIHYRNGEYEIALQNYEMNLAIKRKISSNIDVSPALSNIGAVYLDMGELKKALAYFKDSIKSIDRNNNADTSALAFRFVNIGFIYGMFGDLNKATSYFENAISIYKNINNEFLLAKTFGYLGKVLYCQNNQMKAEKYLENSLKKLVEHENDFEISRFLYDLIIVKIELNKISEAIGLLGRFTDIVEKNNNDIIKMRYRLAEAMISKNLTRLNDKVKALDTFNEIIDNPKMNELIKNEARLGLCEILLMEYETVDNLEIKEELVSLINKIYKYSQKENAFPYLIRTLKLKANVLIKTGEIIEALKLIEIAEFYADERGLNLEKTKLEKVRLTIMKKASVQEIFHQRFSVDLQAKQEQEILEYLNELKKFKFDTFSSS